MTSPSPIARPDRPGAGAAGGGGLAPPVIVDDTFAPVTVVTRAEIERDGARTLGDLLFDEARHHGIDLRARRARAGPSSAASTTYRVRIQENGIGDAGRLRARRGPRGPDRPAGGGPDRGDPRAGDAPLRLAARSAASCRPPTTGSRPSFRRAGFSGRTHGRRVLAPMAAARRRAPWTPAPARVAAHADWFDRSSDDYRTPDGIQRNSAARSDGAAAGLSSILPNGFVGIGVSARPRQLPDPGHRCRRQPHPDRPEPGQGLREGRAAAVARCRRGRPVLRSARPTTSTRRSASARTAPFGPQATFRNREQEVRLEVQHVPVFTAARHADAAPPASSSSHRAIGTSGEAGGLLLPTEPRRTRPPSCSRSLQVGGGASASRRRAGPSTPRVRGTATTFPTRRGNRTGATPTSRARTREFGPKSASLGALLHAALRDAWRA